MMKLLLQIIVLIFSVIPLNAHANQKCHSDLAIHHHNRFKNCNKGDVITVASIISSKNFASYDDTQDGIMHINEIGEYCSYEHAIAELGEFVVRGAKTRVYSCVYIGKSRESHF